MCGICGKLNFEKDRTIGRPLLKTMLDTIRHRGPDGDGLYVQANIGLGHRRLAIIDLNTGQQPLSNEDGSVWIVFNGEIYNYQELRRDLVSKGHTFRTQSDTEVIVHLYEDFGPSCIDKLRGMFAFAIWDARNDSLLLARDRVGIKPLYYHLGTQGVTFASEIKAILADPEVKAEVLPEMIDRFLTFYYMPGEETLFRKILKLAPGTYMVIKNGKVQMTQYWDLQFNPGRHTMEQAEEELMHLLEESVRLHMISDVPVGFLLSGGVDSTAMLSFAVGKTKFPLSSYTLGFSAPHITDERPFAQLAARTYGSEHHEMTISHKDFVDFLPSYVWHMEEPVCEPPAVALFYVSKLAKDFVKVLISGEGGDEAFAGYPNYRTMLWMERAKSIFGPFQGLLSASVKMLNAVLLHSEQVKKYAPLLKTPFESYYYSRTSTPFLFFNNNVRQFYSPDFLSHVDKVRSCSVVTRYLQNGNHLDRVNRMLYADTKTWLTDDLLLKADKMTMANSIELRVPLLDHKLLEFAACLPGSFKVRGLTTKYLAKRTLGKRVPREILDRKKTGFPVPYASWLRNELREWLTEILLDRTTLERGYFNKSTIDKLIRDNVQTGRYPKEIFSLVVLELWHRVFIDGQKDFESKLSTVASAIS